MTARKTGAKTTETADSPSFEKSLGRLEKIVSEMESGSLDLEDMIGRFEEGQGLIKFCAEKLNEVERKIEVLVKKDGKVRSEPFDNGRDTAAESGGEGALQENSGDRELF